jgi:hypothetical protein
MTFDLTDPIFTDEARASTIWKPTAGRRELTAHIAVVSTSIRWLARRKPE